jgi:hypothetical protein
MMAVTIFRVEYYNVSHDENMHNGRVMVDERRKNDRSNRFRQTS